MVSIIQLLHRASLIGIVALAAGLILLFLLWREGRKRRRAQRLRDELRSQLQTVTATMREGVIAYDMDRKLRF
ncbi:MAG: hypothetical protein ACJ8AM_11025, partial [Gemmatimonadales bacterium]